MAFVFAPLFSGSSGNALYVERDETCLLIDAGLAGRRIEKELEKAGGDIRAVQAVFVTHEHEDHVAGVGVLARRWGLRVYATAPTWAAMCSKLGEIPPGQCAVVEPGVPVRIGSLSVTAFPIPHDAACPVGYAISDGRRKLSVATDIGSLRDEWLDAVAESDLLLLEANHDVAMLKASRYPYDLKLRIGGPTGHLSNEDAALAAAKLCRRGVKQILLGHLSHENNFPELAWETVAGSLRALGEEGNIPLGVALRSGFSGRYVLEEDSL